MSWLQARSWIEIVCDRDSHGVGATIRIGVACSDRKHPPTGPVMLPALGEEPSPQLIVAE